jgi:hypothetical protein
MNTRLILGALITVLSIIVLAICYLGERNPRKSFWTSENYMANIIAFTVGGIVLGPMLLAEAFLVNLDMLSRVDIMGALGILAAGAIILFMMRIKKRVAAYDALLDTPEFRYSGKQGPGRDEAESIDRTLGSPGVV